jgi:uncharacterized protein (TIGR02001 family)
MKLSQGLVAAALLSAGIAAHAVDLSATLTATTDYDFRGITQSAQNPAAQGSIDLSTDAGFYAGVWGSNIDFGNGDPNVEVDYYAGWSGGEDVTWDVGINYYTYVNQGSWNYPEYYASVGYKWFEAKAWYGTNYGGVSGKDEHYYEGNVDYPLPYGLGFTAHAGYSNGNGIRYAYGQSSYMDWAAGLTYSWEHFDMSLRWVDGSDLKTLNNTHDDISSSDGRVIFQVSTTFPWKDEE